MGKQIADYQAEVGAWSQKNFPLQTSVVSLLKAQSELGELSDAHALRVQRIKGFDDYNKAAAAKEDAIGDVCICLLDYCGREGLSFERALENAWAEVSTRDWVAYPKTGRPAPSESPSV